MPSTNLTIEHTQSRAYPRPSTQTELKLCLELQHGSPKACYRVPRKRDLNVGEFPKLPIPTILDPNNHLDRSSLRRGCETHPSFKTASGSECLCNSPPT